MTQPDLCVVIQSGAATLEIGQRGFIQSGETGDMIVRPLHQCPRGAGQ